MNGTWNQSQVDQWYQQNLAAGVSKSKLDALVQQQQADYLVRQGVPAADIETSPVKLRGQVQEAAKGGYRPALTAAEKKATTQFKTLKSNIDILEKNLEQVEVRGPAAGRLGFISGITGGKVFPEVRDYEALRKSMIAPIARTISGEVGVLTDKDIARAEGMLPKIWEDPGVARRKLSNIRELVSERLGEEPPVRGEAEVAEPGVTGQIPSTLQKALGLIPPAAGIAAGMIPGLGQIPGVRGAVAGAGYAAGGRAQQVLREEAPPEARQWGLAGRAPTGGEMGQIGSGALMDLLLRGAGGLLRKGGLKGVVGKTREKVAKEITEKVSATKIVKPIEEFIKRHPEARTKDVLKIIEELKRDKTLPVSDILQRTQVWNDAYRAGGGLKAGVKNKVYDLLAKAGKAEIKRIAPEVAKQTAKLRFLYQAPRTASKAAWQALKIGGLGRMLGL